MASIGNVLLPCPACGDILSVPLLAVSELKDTGLDTIHIKVDIDEVRWGPRWEAHLKEYHSHGGDD